MVEEEKKQKRILVVTGTRDANINNEQFILETLRPYFEWADQVFVGDATGVDKIVRNYCSKKNIFFKPFQALWHKYGQSAGPKRNEQMINEAIEVSGKIFDNVVVCAFPLKGANNSKGTRGCMKIANDKQLRVDVYEI